MNRKTTDVTDNKTGRKRHTGADQGALEKIAQFIDPAGREISDEELSDPGANTPSTKPDTNRSGHDASGNKS